jgi:hypothetical protein
MKARPGNLKSPLIQTESESHPGRTTQGASARRLRGKQAAEAKKTRTGNKAAPRRGKQGVTIGPSTVGGPDVVITPP